MPSRSAVIKFFSYFLANFPKRKDVFVLVMSVCPAENKLSLHFFTFWTEIFFGRRAQHDETRCKCVKIWSWAISRSLPSISRLLGGYFPCGLGGAVDSRAWVDGEFTGSNPIKKLFLKCKVGITVTSSFVILLFFSKLLPRKMRFSRPFTVTFRIFLAFTVRCFYFLLFRVLFLKMFTT